MDKTPFIIAASFISIAAVANLIRFFWDIPITLGTWMLPGWTGGILFILLGLLAAWVFRAIWASSPPPNH